MARRMTQKRRNSYCCCVEERKKRGGYIAANRAYYFAGGVLLLSFSFGSTKEGNNFLEKDTSSQLTNRREKGERENKSGQISIKLLFSYLVQALSKHMFYFCRRLYSFKSFETSSCFLYGHLTATLGVKEEKERKEKFFPSSLLPLAFFGRSVRDDLQSLSVRFNWPPTGEEERERKKCSPTSFRVRLPRPPTSTKFPNLPSPEKKKKHDDTSFAGGRAMMSSESFFSFFLLHPMGLGSTFWAREGGPSGSPPSLPIFLLLPKVHQFRSNSSLDMPQSRNTMAPLPSKDFKVGF